jgi:hypothetical protein
MGIALSLQRVELARFEGAKRVETELGDRAQLQQPQEVIREFMAMTGDFYK